MVPRVKADIVIRCAAVAATAGLWAAALSGTGGCRTTRHGTAVTAGDDIHRLIRDKVRQQARHQSGEERWETLTRNLYQSDADFAADRAGLGNQAERTNAASRLLQTGPVDLEACMAFALEFNDELQAARADLRAAGGEAMITHARFLPAVVYDLQVEHTRLEGVSATNETHQSVRLTQRLLEFGEDNADDVALRETQREALFDYEDTVRDVLSEVRKRFFTVILRGQQLDERQKSLQDFLHRYRKIKELEEARRVLEVDVLTARLNMLNEQARINSLEKEIFRRKSDLLYLMGFPIGMTAMEVRGRVENFDMLLPEAVNLALRRSPAVAEARAAVAEQARRFKETLWDYAPAVGLQAGWKDDRNTYGLELGTSDRLYTLSSYAEAHADPFEGYLANESDLLDEEEEGWFVDLSLELPLFQGFERKGRYRRQKALLQKARHTLRDTADALELQVRKLYQTMLERRQEVDILRETVAISTQRLRVQERLKDLGRISDNQLETFRTKYFEDQDELFSQQIALVDAQEDLRFAMRHFEPLAPAEE